MATVDKVDDAAVASDGYALTDLPSDPFQRLAECKARIAEIVSMCERGLPFDGHYLGLLWTQETVCKTMLAEGSRTGCHVRVQGPRPHLHAIRGGIESRYA